MPVLTVALDDDVSAQLGAISAESHRDPSEVAAEAIRRYVSQGAVQRALRDPRVQALYRELASEDFVLAEAGMAEYGALLDDADRNTSA